MNSTTEKLAFLFGLLGNIVSFMVFLAPMPTFYRIYQKKSSEGFQSIPYVVALLSAMLLLYYGLLKTNAMLIISINAFGIVIELAYLIFYFTYAPKKQRIFTLKLVLLVIVMYGLTVAITIFLLSGTKRVSAVGWICAVFNIAVFAAPLSIMRQVIRTRSVEYMPFTLSLFLTLCATMWFFYGLFTQDYYIALPNVLGFLFGIAQMILYMVYRNSGKDHNEIEAKTSTNGGDLEMRYKQLSVTSTSHQKLYRSIST
ncbi:bidirectional sugar transporter NEC1-like [Argentina anserina]|uniref:bidirectional sugar transporter NEC1-like n=1 Tax=Argentina anserina TaxID=57926 RepID=UPI00217628C1|nr:bidirectional sugar transporter NEC1-like [Potentilla anserina]